MLTISNLHTQVEEQKILKGLSLEVKPGQIHIIMGPNAAGKSTLTGTLAGNPVYRTTQGTVTFAGKNLLELEIEDRAREGLFIGFQNPVEIPGVNLTNFLKTAYNQKRKHQNQKEIDSKDFIKLIKEKIKLLNLPQDFYQKNVNEGLSGGQKKLSELLQMAILEPKLAVLDEIDSGLDVDNLKLVASNLEKLKTPKNAIILITHNNKILEYIKPDFVHVLVGGRIVKSGDSALASEIEREGYKKYETIK